MTISTTVSVAASNTLAALNNIVAQQEAIHGPLLGIGNDGSTTHLTFDNTPASPAVNALIAPQTGGVPTIPAGSTLVCTGTVFIAGTPTLSAATRAAAAPGAS
jgi:hypothetical protein